MAEMARTVAMVILALFWAGFFVIYGVVHFLFVDLPMRYTSVLQDTPRSYLWIGAGILVWGSIGLLFPGVQSAIRSAHSWHSAVGMLVVAVFNGGLAGRLALDLGNGLGDPSPGETARYEVKPGGHTSVEIHLIEPYPGTKFNVYSGMMWRLNKDPNRAFVVHRGRLGLLWGEFR